jgi:nitrite reductase/ring-hydroxylating ferredoxin subunit
MANYVEVANLEQLPPGRGTTVSIEGKEIALFNVDGTVYAIDDACLHHGVSLGLSKVEGNIITCRGHGWKYDVTSGSTYPVPGIGVAAYPVKVVDGKIMVAIDKLSAIPIL